MYADCDQPATTDVYGIVGRNGGFTLDNAEIRPGGGVQFDHTNLRFCADCCARFMGSESDTLAIDIS